MAKDRQAVKTLVKLGLYILLASIPFEMPRRQSIPIEMPTFAGAIFLAAALIQPRRSFGRVPQAVWWFFGFLCVFAISTSVNFLNDVYEVVQLFLLVFQGVLVFWAAANILDDESTATGAWVTYALACMLRAGLPMLGIGRTSVHVWTGGERLSAFGQNENNAAIILACGVIALLGLGYARAHRVIRPRWLVLPGCALMGYAVIETASRGGLAALVVGLATFMLSRGQSAWQRLRNGAFAMVALAIILFVAFQTPVMGNRLRDTESSGTMAGREGLYPILGQMFIEKPVLGWGPLNNHYELSLREGNRFLIRRDTHNLVLEVLTSTGFVGTVLFFVPVFLCCIAAWRARQGPEGILPLALLVCVLMGDMSGDWIASKLLWLSLAYAVASARRGALPPVRAPVRVRSGPALV